MALFELELLLDFTVLRVGYVNFLRPGNTGGQRAAKRRGRRLLWSSGDGGEARQQEPHFIWSLFFILSLVSAHLRTLKKSKSST